MSHYEERLERDVARIRERLEAVGAKVEAALETAVSALLAGDRGLANETALGDLAINREIRGIDRLCHAFVARHLPSAGHLRFVSSVLRLNIAIERIGDYAVAICRESLQLGRPPQGTVARDVELMGRQCRRLLHQALDAFHGANAELARGTRALAAEVGSTFDKVMADLVTQGESEQMPLKDLFALLVIFNRLERVGDQAKNLCEETIFTATGETKAPKVYRILFVDETNRCQSQLAAAYARRAFPESGEYASAGWRPAAAPGEGFLRFLDEHGMSTAGLKPSAPPTSHEQLAQFHVLVSLAGDVRPHLPELAFHTIVLEWDVGSEPEPGSAGEREALEAMYKNVAVKTRELMEALRGEDAH